MRKAAGAARRSEESLLARNSTGQRGRNTPRSRKPVTIDLSAEEVARREAENAATASDTPPPADESVAEAAENSARTPEAEPEPAAGESETPEIGDAVADHPPAEAGPAISGSDKADVATPAEASGEAPSDTSKPPSPSEPSDDSDREAAAPAPPPPEPPRVHPMLPLVGAALLGGAVVALVIIVLALAGFFRPLPPPEVPNYGPEIAALKSDVAALKSAPAPEDLTPLRDRLAALEQSVSALQEAAAAQPSASDAAALSAVEDRVATLEQDFQAINSSPASAEDGSALAAKVNALSDAVDTLRSRNPVAELSSLESTVQALSQKLDTVSADMANMPGEARVAAIEEKLGALSTDIASVPREDRIAAIEKKLDALGAEMDKAAALGPAVAAAALGAAIDAGRPFGRELAALAALGIDDDSVAALKPEADAGLPTLAALSARFDKEIESIDLSTPVPEGAGALDRLLESARGLVAVRPAKPVAGSDPEAIVTRIRGALAAGDLKTALDEWNTLPQAIKDATADWAKSAETRKTADDLVAQLRAVALARLDTER